MARAAPLQPSFNAGELSKKLGGRVDIAKYGGGCQFLENFIPVIQGPAQRRSGFRFVAEVKDSSKRVWLVKFEFNVQQAYILEFGEGYIRFFTNHGQLQVSGVPAYSGATAYVKGDLVVDAGINYYCIAPTTGNAPPNATYWYALTGNNYEIPSPYTASDLTNPDGTFGLGLVESADIVYIVCANQKPQKLSRFGVTNWQLATLAQTWGPFQPTNITNTTVYASAATGATTLTASAPIFDASMVGEYFYLGQKTVLSVPLWEAGKAVLSGVLRRSDGKNYLSLNAATTGGIKPTHNEGAVFDGDTGVQWEFQDAGYGYVLLTAFTSSTVMDGTVISKIPDNAVLVANASTKWAKSAWGESEGYPTKVTFFKERLTFARGQTVWLSVSGDYENFNTRDDGGLVVTDSAIIATISSDTVNNVTWLSPADALIVGTAGGEFSIKPLTDQQAFGPDNVQAVPISSFGSKAIQPSNIGDVVLFIQRAGLKLRDIIFDFISNGFKSSDQNALADHITESGVVQMAYQQEPYSINWSVLSNGKLVGMTYSREQYADPPYGGWHGHKVGEDGLVECVATIPNQFTDGDELWIVTQFVIDGNVKRYIGYLEKEFTVDADPQDCFFVDYGLTLDNVQNATLTPDTGADVQYTENVEFEAGSAIFSAGDVGKEIHYHYSFDDIEGKPTWYTSKALITAYTDTTHVDCTINYPFPDLNVIGANEWRLTVTTISGLDHLEGRTVDILADGAKSPQRVVTGGEITLQDQASKIHIGLPMPARLKTMRLNAGAQDGTSQGKTARINKVAVRLLSSLGLQVGPSFDKLDDIEFRQVQDLMDNVPALFEGDAVVDFAGDYTTDPWLCFQQTDPLPCTIVAIMPTISTYDRG